MGGKKTTELLLKYISLIEEIACLIEINVFREKGKRMKSFNCLFLHVIYYI